jgi:hypothetical protein
MKQKRALLLASGIIFVIIAVLYAMIALAAMPNIDTVIMPIVKAELDELVLIGEIELTENTLESIKSVINVVLIFMVVIAIVDMIIGVMLIRRSKESDKVILEKKSLVVTAIIVSVFTSGLITTILLVCALYKPVETLRAEAVMTNSTVENIEQKQVNDKYEIKIRRLQDLRDKGAITKEEYQKLLKQIFED